LILYILLHALILGKLFGALLMRHNLLIVFMMPVAFSVKVCIKINRNRKLNGDVMQQNQRKKINIVETIEVNMMLALQPYAC
jgi:hypothetical protein